ncbi:hypothetical protein BD324DRAFT_675232 [Kockovaella imperatae]|uniref:Ser-Thr-rich glycosyl-phosphatidyl-inositol-anchored membrane family-domain-containing protein n=1 Tax=Kockovaella imperatae TaxID=4999 RepID=A0A1Y1UFD5_9TREE|nr:hypothetical protein BD324DRAFT_675232 [Kockovaella imperatae]ORX36738.1 hypothetical protein BD324DRAFT_675232 [Kockovaella imperatae]
MLARSLLLTALAGSSMAQLLVNTISSLIVCQPALITWSGGTAPYFLAVIPGGDPSGIALKNFPQQSGTQLTWDVDIAAGTSVTIKITDSSGAVNYNSQVTIQPGSTTACIGQDDASGGAAAGAAAASGASGDSTVSGTSAGSVVVSSAVASGSSAAAASRSSASAANAVAAQSASGSRPASASTSRTPSSSNSAASGSTTSGAALPLAISNKATPLIAVIGAVAAMIV